MTKKVTQNVTNSNSEDLTELWKKGELINGKKYYITFFDSEPFEATFRYYEAMIPYWKFEANGKQYCDENGYDCVKVLALVPSYDEWQVIKKYNKTAREIINTQAEENKNLKEELQNQAFILKSRESEIVKKETQRIKLMTKLNDVNNENHALRIENNRLKELLKESIEPLEVLAEKRGACDWCPEDLLAKIKQVLGEE